MLSFSWNSRLLRALDEHCRDLAQQLALIGIEIAGFQRKEALGLESRNDFFVATTTPTLHNRAKFFEFLLVELRIAEAVGKLCPLARICLLPGEGKEIGTFSFA